MRNPKTDFNAEISVFGFSFLPLDWEIRKKRFEKLSLRTAVLHAHAQLAKQKTVCPRPWGRISRRWNPFFGFRVRFQNPKSGFQNLNPDFPTNATSICGLMYVRTGSPSLVPRPDLATQVSRGGLKLTEREFFRQAWHVTSPPDVSFQFVEDDWGRDWRSVSARREMTVM